jgi:hypothetical protein
MGILFRSYSDEEVVKAILKGGTAENKVTSYVLKKNEASIYSFVLKNSGNSSFANIILVEGVTELILNIRNGKFRAESALSTYLFSICKSLWLKQLKKESRHADWDENEESEFADEPINTANEDNLKIGLNMLLSKIGQDCKRVLELWSLKYSMTEIAISMDYKNAQIAMNKKNKCLTKLKSLVSSNDQYRDQLQNYMS